MRNLKLLYSNCVFSDLLKDAQALCIESDSESIYFADFSNFYCVKKGSKEVSCVPMNLDIKCEGNVIVQMDYVLETQSICVTFSSGDIVVYNILEEKAECVGFVESQVHHAAWSPDQELLVVLTGGNTFILMTKEFDPLVEKVVHSNEFGESRPVSVGWGSKETQFHGSEGKGAAKVKAMEPKPIVPWDDQRHRISWRGDGEYFVTSVIDPEYDCRKLRIWNREGNLQFTSELKDMLEQSLCWRPSGNLITCTQQHPNKHEVIFFEKNGLQHGEFSLPYPPNTFAVREVLWNSDSSVLAIWGHKIGTTVYSVSLWTVKNYHWYLKQELVFADDGKSIIRHVYWDQNYPYRLHVFCCGGKYLQYTWGWTHFSYQQSSDIFVFDQREEYSRALDIAVIDNCNVLVTPVDKMIIPPPMCAYSLKLPCAVNEVVFPTSRQSGDFCLILSDGRVAFFSRKIPEVPDSGCELIWNAAGGNGFTKCVDPHYCQGIYRITWDNYENLKQYPLSFSHWTWRKYDNVLLCTYAYPDCNEAILFSIEIPAQCYDIFACFAAHLAGVSKVQTTEITYLKGKFCAKVDNTVIGMNTCVTGYISVLHLSTGQFLKYKPGELSPWLINDKKELILPVCSQFSLYKMEKEVIMCLTEKFSLYCNDKLLTSSCTSYAWHGDYLLTTSCNNLLKFYRKSAIAKLCSGKAEVSDCDIPSQQIERGSRIVISVHGDTKLILQMPRGNLEVIHPRPVVLSFIIRHLDCGYYRKAFEIAKKHRINLNILYDHDPQQFLENVGEFFEEIDSPSDINIFLASLLNENVRETMYSYAYVDVHKVENDCSNKKDLICNAIEAVIRNKEYPKEYFQTLIATYAQKTNPELDKALMKIWHLRTTDVNAKDPDTQKNADDALKFLLYLVDVNELYKVALGTYHFQIAIMVAEKSNMDPKEYMPFLNELQELEKNYREYKVDMHLQRYKEALQHISKCDDKFQECLDLICEQKLHKEALHIFPWDSERFKTVWENYGNYLMFKKHFGEAGLAYLKSKNSEKALKAFEENGDWQLAVCEARRLEYSEARMSLLYKNLSRKLEDQERYQEAASLLERAEDFDRSAECLIKGHLWDSWHELFLRRSENFKFVPLQMMFYLPEHCSKSKEFLNQAERDFSRHLERLKVVRKHASLQCEDNPEEELFSETSSVTGDSSVKNKLKQLSGSLMTRQTSRNQKKEAMKKYRLKEGSANEDLALIYELKDIITKVDQMKDTFFSFMRILVMHDIEGTAMDIQTLMKKVIKVIDDGIDTIWLPEGNVKPSLIMNFGPDCTANDIATAMETRKNYSQRYMSDPLLAPPTWRKNVDMFLNYLE